MPSLLDLPDERLITIASFLDPENSLPLPSWKPFWDNSPSPLDRKASKDLRAFRATARRIRRALKLEGQFLVIKTTAVLTDWRDNAEDDMKQAIRMGSREPPGEIERHLVVFFSAFWGLLQQLPNLVELLVTDVPGCIHYTHDSIPDDQFWGRVGVAPLGLQLRKVKSVSIDLTRPD
ncbi:hypothetical protein JCM24511_02779 [Saitozyma sp. JCM 24511]|nr:hypothetical protein JCM24511_02779 [Saitozyma sp. JCM 24511]